MSHFFSIDRALRREKTFPWDFARKVDLIPSLMFNAAMQNEPIYSLEANVSKSTKLNERRAYLDGSRYKEGYFLVKKGKSTYRAPSIDDCKTPRELLAEAQEENPQVEDFTIKQRTLLVDPIDHPNFDGVEKVLVYEQNARSLGQKSGFRNVMNTYREMRYELSKRGQLTDRLKEILRGHGILKPHRVIGDTGHIPVRAAKLFRPLYPDETAEDNAAYDFFKSLTGRDRWWSDMALPLILYPTQRNETAALVFWLPSYAQHLAVNIGEDINASYILSNYSE